MAPILLRWCKTEQVVIGGGAALAARWCHRKSTDIDLFMKIEDFLSIKDGLESDLAQAKGVLDWRSGQGWCRGSFAEGEFSIFSTPPLLSMEVVGEIDFAEQGGLKMEFVAEILAKKLRLRMYGNGECLARDCYDLVTAAEQQPQALNIALSCLTGDQKEELVNEFNLNWNKHTLAGRPLQEVHHPEWLSDLATRTSRIIENSLGIETDPSSLSSRFKPI